MDSINRQLVEQLFSPLRATFSPPRPDGGIVLSLLDASDATAYSRVLSAAQRADSQAFAQSLEDIRLELAMRSGNIPADMRKALKEQDSVLSYQTN
ncbi:DUF3509 domain-containing protein [Pseudomonas spirodelae]|uniref:DUF3509 domain-containing protein n=1 Tax=Pseudomonas spirodelae TaxID=3101751 RepID=A0ABU5P7N2_9PSED|nr:DUF3509 domain-containing protein [Pseudomonas sp. T5W1]MBU0808471.1 DUF3509 domain-containing protein [Gammaproteobacteria bacterium]MBU0884774.1 DUF3509 domain-containing protein [Gammaproteobacteria bacterium]MBU0901077.1 DUF3509 domain-containing protein [Gammaproteobacteria bacterium]MBU1858926.1 DUF3509 domain-containing protein [Gammaproteobacteria bacterium]MEA1605656.1 DUF3509 domain-containing protein [Pseudomonas sp. T5W1]